MTNHPASLTSDCPVDAVALDAAATLIRHYEGCARRCADGRIGPYQDVKGIWTIGWGNTCWRDGRPIAGNDEPITQAEADVLLDFHLRQFAGSVEELLPPTANALQAAALTSLAYNIGIDSLKHSTVLKRLLNGDLTGAAEAIEWWNKADGKVVKGLQRRRRAERLVFEGTPPSEALSRAEQAFG